MKYVALGLCVAGLLFILVPLFLGPHSRLLPKWYKRFQCWKGGHSWPDFASTGFDGCSVHAKCLWCGYEGMIDGQGNLF